MGIETAGTPADQAQDEFEAAFAEASKGRVGASGEGLPAANQEDAGTGDKTAAAAKTNDTTPGAQGSGDAGKAAAAGSTEQPVPGSASEVEQLRQQLATANDQLAQALHRERSNANRISTVDRRSNTLATENADLKRQVSELQAQLKNRPAPQASAGGDGKDILALTPELEAAVNARISEATSGLQTALDNANAKLAEVGETAVRAAGAVAPVVQRQQQDNAEAVRAALDADFSPTWRQDIRTPAFAQWLPKQPKAIQQMYDDGETVTDTKTVLELFYAQRGNRPRPEQQPQGNTAQQDAQRETPAATKPGNDAQARLRDAAGIAPRSSRAVADAIPDDDFDGHFARAASERQRQTARMN